jgi:hypothetical protein
MNTIRITLAAVAALVTLPVASQAQQGHGRSTAGGAVAARSTAPAARGFGGYRSGYRSGYGYRYGGGYRYWNRGRGYYVYGNPYFFGYPFGYPYYYGPGYGVSYSYPIGGYDGDAIPTGRIVDESGSSRRRGEGEAQTSLAAAVQRELKDRGFYSGPVDGQFGSGSRAALRRFQRKAHLPETGRLDEKTLDALDFERR